MNYVLAGPKWLNFAWDAFRIVENHNKSHFFQLVNVSPLDGINFDQQMTEQTLYESGTPHFCKSEDSNTFFGLIEESKSQTPSKAKSSINRRGRASLA
jgi:hypothetical protein